MTELKPCPFCGGEVVLQALYGGNYVECGTCKCSTERFIEMEDAINAWNKRPNPWHTGTPTEEGWYLLAFKEDGRRIYDANRLKNGIWEYCLIGDILKWQKIEGELNG